MIRHIVYFVLLAFCGGVTGLMFRVWVDPSPSVAAILVSVTISAVGYVIAEPIIRAIPKWINHQSRR